jgi:hypothetical protein
MALMLSFEIKKSPPFNFIREVENWFLIYTWHCYSMRLSSWGSCYEPEGLNPHLIRGGFSI